MAIAAAVGSPVFSPTITMLPRQDKVAIKIGHLSSGSESSETAGCFRGCASSTLDLESPPFTVTRVHRTSSALKRKRPSKINIPLPESSSTCCLLNEREDASRGRDYQADLMQDQGQGYSVYCKRGKVRARMEDRHCAGVDIGGQSKLAFFDVFDGHGGAEAAEFCAKNLLENVVDEVSRISEGEEDGMKEAVRSGYLRTDSDLMREKISGGSCSVTALIRNNDLTVSNAGDCRAVMSRGGVAEPLTSDHRPSREDEKERIQHNGGYVDCHRGIWRIEGTLAVTRGIGDSNLKKWVVAEPETVILRIKPECEFLILASDGLWDKVSNQEAVDMVRPMCMDSSLLSACKNLADLSISRGSLDDVSVMIIHFRNFV
ncbi:putative protein phosphatase 2C 30 [Zostera marina]|uniref:protein-serine/threonine phosphatase n=1 Tax=Zostera marina TaxID=29655 RepID=A0A0K9PRC5_ZOSMR|nr:putative protein phosphatase 2C 30 [Zostera marina]